MSVSIGHIFHPARGVEVRIFDREAAEGYAELLDAQYGDVGFRGDAAAIRDAIDRAWPEWDES